eukprot:4781328-Pleurochrysis_carterae.AAC.1
MKPNAFKQYQVLWYCLERTPDPRDVAGQKKHRVSEAQSTSLDVRSIVTGPLLLCRFFRFVFVCWMRFMLERRSLRRRAVALPVLLGKIFTSSASSKSTWPLRAKKKSSR